MRRLTLCLVFAMTVDVNSTDGQAPGAASAAASAAADGVFRSGTMKTGGGEIDYSVFVPAALPPAGQRALLVMVHGCTQDAADFARGTRVNTDAAVHGYVVLWPQQRAANHIKKCWNWYEPAHMRRGAGEMARLHALVAATIAEQGVDRARVFMSGVSAGGAMALNYAAAHPEDLRAIAVHSSPPSLAAADVMTALAVMAKGPVEPADAMAQRVRDVMGGAAHAMPLLAMHGAADPLVSPKNLEALAAQWRSLHALLGEPARVETHLIPGLAHAWSGGSADGTFTDPKTVSATQLMLEFFRGLGLPGGAR